MKNPHGVFLYDHDGGKFAGIRKVLFFFSGQLPENAERAKEFSSIRRACLHHVKRLDAGESGGLFFEELQIKKAEKCASPPLFVTKLQLERFNFQKVQLQP